MEKVRVDRWLWAVRLTKTRSGAAQACRAGHVQINGVRAKPAATVKPGDTVRLRIGDRERVVEVVRLIETRVGAEPAAACLIDKSPPPPPRDPLDQLRPPPPRNGPPNQARPPPPRPHPRPPPLTTAAHPTLAPGRLREAVHSPPRDAN